MTSNRFLELLERRLSHPAVVSAASNAAWRNGSNAPEEYSYARCIGAASHDSGQFADAR